MEDLVSAMDKEPGYSYFYNNGLVRPALEHATSAWSYAITKAELECLKGKLRQKLKFHQL